MVTTGAKGAGRIHIDVEVTNNDDLALVSHGLLQPDQVRRDRIRGIVDSGAATLVLPEAVVKQLGLRLANKVKVRYAAGRRVQRRETAGVQIEILGRQATFNAVVEPKRDTALIGAIVLVALDLLVDCKKQRLVPRDPSGPVFEIE
jgi:clan AA aspartic protease